MVYVYAPGTSALEAVTEETDRQHWRDLLEQIRPLNPAIAIQHVFLEGDPAEEIIHYAADARAVVEALLPLVPERGGSSLESLRSAARASLAAEHPAEMEFLDSFAPDILCEVLAGVAETRRLEGLLTPHGYGFHLVRETDLFPASRIQPHARFRDWFFTRRTREELEAMGIPMATRVARSR